EPAAPDLVDGDDVRRVVLPAALVLHRAEGTVHGHPGRERGLDLLRIGAPGLEHGRLEHLDRVVAERRVRAVGRGAEALPELRVEARGRRALVRVAERAEGVAV